MCRFGTTDDVPVFGNASKGLHQGFGILTRVAEQSEESRFPPVVRMGLVQKIVEHLPAIDDGEASVAKLHVACILARVQKGSHDDRFKVHHPLHGELLGDSTEFIQLEPLAPPRRVRQRFECDSSMPRSTTAGVMLTTRSGGAEIRGTRAHHAEQQPRPRLEASSPPTKVAF